MLQQFAAMRLKPLPMRPQTAKKVKKQKKAEQPATPSTSSSQSDQSVIDATDAAVAVSPPVTAAAEVAAEADPLALDNFSLSPAVKKLLNDKGIKALFPIQVSASGHVRHAGGLLACMQGDFSSPCLF